MLVAFQKIQCILKLQKYFAFICEEKLGSGSHNYRGLFSSNIKSSGIFKGYTGHDSSVCRATSGKLPQRTVGIFPLLSFP